MCRLVSVDFLSRKIYLHQSSSIKSIFVWKHSQNVWLFMFSFIFFLSNMLGVLLRLSLIHHPSYTLGIFLLTQILYMFNFPFVTNRKKKYIYSNSSFHCSIDFTDTPFHVIYNRINCCVDVLFCVCFDVCVFSVLVYNLQKKNLKTKLVNRKRKILIKTDRVNSV